MPDGSSSASIPLLSETADSPPQSEKIQREEKALRFQDVGVWTIMREASVSWTVPGRPALDRGKQMLAMLPFVYRFIRECFCVAPWMLTVYLVTTIWSGTEVRDTDLFE
jgi:hypothetical protein